MDATATPAKPQPDDNNGIYITHLLEKLTLARKSRKSLLSAARPLAFIVLPPRPIAHRKYRIASSPRSGGTPIHSPRYAAPAIFKPPFPKRKLGLVNPRVRRKLLDYPAENDWLANAAYRRASHRAFNLVARGKKMKTE